MAGKKEERLRGAGPSCISATGVISASTGLPLAGHPSISPASLFLGWFRKLRWVMCEQIFPTCRVELVCR